MRTGNVVKWSKSLWIVTDYVEHIVDKNYTTRCELVSFEHENMSAGLTDKADTKFSIDDATFVASNVKVFIMNNLRKTILAH
jgi:hypothetical protein